MIKGIFIIIAFELLLPVIAGLPFAASGDRKNRFSFIASALCHGQVLLFALFQPLCVYSILKHSHFSAMMKKYLILAAVLVIICAVIFNFMYKRKKDIIRKKSYSDKISVWGILACLAFAFMIVMSFFMTYADGDDAYYVATSVVTDASDLMYVVDPYTGLEMLAPYRYLFAPFSVWITMLIRLSGIKGAVVAHTLFPWSMILLSFLTLYLLSEEIFEKRKDRDLFLFFSSVLILFGDYSIYTPENFLIARSRQGKAALCSFVIPFLILILYKAYKEADRKKINIPACISVFAISFSAALCSTMGGLMCVGCAFIFACFTCIFKKKVIYPVLIFISTLPVLVFLAMFAYLRSLY